MAIGGEINVDLEPGLINQQYRQPPGTVPIPTDPAGGAGVVPVASGGTGSSSTAGARSNLGAAAAGANSDITSLTGLTTPLSVAQGGTGGATAAAARTGLEIDAIATKKSKLDATVAPTVNEDSGDGYAPGSIWLDLTADQAYMCLDSTLGAAVWKQLSV